MAHYLCCATGNLTSSATWRTVDSTAKVTEGGAQATTLTTTSQGTGSFIPGAIEIDAIAIKVFSRADGTPTNTMTLELYDVTSSSSVVSVAVPVADLPKSTNGSFKRAGWRLFSLGGNYTLTAGKSYIIRLSLNNTSTAVAIFNNGTAANWQHMLRTTTTGAPGANDFMWILGLWTASATWTQYTVTMDQTSTSPQYGTGSTVTTPNERSGIAVGKSTLTWPTAANSVLNLCGFLTAFPEGIINIGTTASPIQRGYTATIQFPVASGFGICQHTDSTVSIAGQSSTASITKIWTTLVENKSSGSTGSLVVADSTNWTSGSTIYLSTSKAVLSGPGQALTMNGPASGTSLPHSGSVTDQYYGSTGSYPYPSIVALTASAEYNVVIQTDAATRYWLYQGGTDNLASTTASCAISWVRFLRGQVDFTNGYYGDITVSNFYIDHLGVTLVTQPTFAFDGLCKGTWSIADIVTINANSYPAYTFAANSSGDVSSMSLQNIICINSGGGGGFNIDIGPWAAMRQLHARKGSIVLDNTGFTSASTDFLSGSTCIGMYAASGALQFPNNWVPAMTITNGAFVGGTNSLYFSVGYLDQLKFVNCDIHCATHIIGNTFDFLANLTFDRCRVGGLKEASQAPTWILWPSGNQARPIRMNFFGCEFSGSHTTQLSSGLYNLQAAGNQSSGLFDLQAVFNPAGFTALPLGVQSSASYMTSSSFVAALDFNSIGDNRVWKPGVVSGLAGAEVPWIGTDSTTYRTAAPSEKLVPKTTASKLESSIKRFAVTSGSTASVGVYAYRDAAYNGNPARLIIKQHNGANYTADTVGATMSTSTGAWEQLTTTIAAVPRDVVLEVCVDCDGTTGSIYLDDWSAT